MTSILVVISLLSSTVITPSSVTFSNASATNFPISGSLFAEIVAICSTSPSLIDFADFLISSENFFAANSIPDLYSAKFVILLLSRSCSILSISA